jgi:hypothetical protein
MQAGAAAAHTELEPEGQEAQVAAVREVPEPLRLQQGPRTEVVAVVERGLVVLVVQEVLALSFSNTQITTL